MKNLLIIAISLLITTTSFGQNGKILTEPGLKKLSVFLGTWKSQSEGAKDQFAIYTCRWSVNGKYLVCDQIVTDGEKKTNNLAIYSYNAVRDTYKLSLVGIPGADPFAIPVTYKSDELVYSGDYMQDGKKVYTRTLNTFISRSYYIYKVQSSKDSINWTISIAGKAVKIAE
ncbi:MAG: hypothetical protein M3N14_01365 [Bacteroidota bacterium]|nr:hypothetical protein [Bacteroidota bacterium]